MLLVITLEKTRMGVLASRPYPNCIVNVSRELVWNDILFICTYLILGDFEYLCFDVYVCWPFGVLVWLAWSWPVLIFFLMCLSFWYLQDYILQKLFSRYLRKMNFYRGEKCCGEGQLPMGRPAAVGSGLSSWPKVYRFFPLRFPRLVRGMTTAIVLPSHQVWSTFVHGHTQC